MYPQVRKIETVPCVHSGLVPRYCDQVGIGRHVDPKDRQT